MLSNEVGVLNECAVDLAEGLQRTGRDCARDIVYGQRNEADEVLLDEALPAMSRNRLHGID